MTAHATPAARPRHTLVPRTPPAAEVENSNGACTCTGRLHTWGSPACDAYSRGEQ